MTTHPDDQPDAKTQHVQHVQGLFVRHVSTLRGFILGLMPDFNMADDILQDVFMVVSARADQYEPDTNFLAWAMTIAKLKVLEYARSARSTPRSLSPEVIEALCDSGPAPAEADEVHAALVQCIDELAPRARQIIQMRYGQGVRPMQIARHLDWKDQSVYVALSRARAFLRDCLNRRMRRDVESSS